MLTIAVDSPEQTRSLVQITDFPCQVGRRKSCGIVLSSWRVASRHAEIRRSGSLYSIVDQGSLGGTWVNGERIAEFGPLSHDDEVLISGFTLRLVSEGVQSVTGLISEASATGEREPLNPSASPLDSGDVTSDAGLEVRRRLHRQLLSRMDLRRQEIRHLNSRELKAQVGEHLDALIAGQPEMASLAEIADIRQAVIDEAVGLGVLEPLLARDDISEIMVNGCEPVYVERHGKLEPTALRFSSAQAIEAVIERIVSPIGRRIDESSPMVDARLPDGSRVNAVVPPLAVKGPALTIRRFNTYRYSAQDLVNLQTASAQMMDFLIWCVKQRRNVVVSGGTGSGKTTLLNVLSSHVGKDERVITIEDAAELQLDHPHLVSLEARPANSEERGAVTIRDLVRNALRMRPDRIVVGECRGGEALDMLQAMNTGHDGSLTTVHANSARDALARLEVMVLMSGIEIPVIAIREQISSAIDVIVQQRRGRDGSRRLVEIVEVGGMDGPVIQTQPLFRFDLDLSQFQCCGHVPQLVDDCDALATEELRRLFQEAET